MKHVVIKYYRTGLLLALILVAFNIRSYSKNQILTDSTILNDTIQKPAAIMISPVGLIAGNYSKLKFRVQGATKKHFAIGSDLKLYFNSYPGFQINPFLKYFVSGNNLKGVYVYGSGLYGMNKKLPPHKTRKYNCYGAGAGIGIQIVIGKLKNGLIDIGMGVKYVATDAAIDINNVPESYDDFFLIGPGAIFDSNLSIGFRF